MRVSKKSVQRRAHLFKTAKHLFETQGYENTSVDQIVLEAGVAKGTFYYYFKSKEEVLDAMMEEIDDQATQLLQPVLDQEMPADEKLRRCLAALREYYTTKHSTLLDYHTLTDELLYYKSMVRSIRSLTHPYAQIIQQGVDEGVFKTKYPTALAEATLTAGHFLLDGETFPTNKDGWRQRIEVIQQILERELEVPEGSLSFLGDWRGLYYNKAEDEE